MEQCGQFSTTTDVDNWPVGVEGSQGPDLMVKMQQQAERFETQIVFDHIEKAQLIKKPFTLKGNSGIIAVTY